jgi:hypothetical protein
MKTAILTSTLLSLALLTVSLSAGKKMVCKDGKCFIDLSSLDKTINNNKSKRNFFPHHKIETKKSLNQQIEKIAFDKSKYVKQDNETVEPLKATELQTIVLPPEKYIMTDKEIESYEAEHIELTLPDRDVEKKIIEKTNLPTSEYFCERNQKLIYKQSTDSLECA